MAPKTQAMPPGCRLIKPISERDGVARHVVDDTILGRRAILELPADKSAGLAAVARTRHGLEHRAIVSQFRFGELDGAPYRLMEAPPGVTLDEHLNAQGILPPSRASDVLERLLGALVAAEELGLCHADLSPDRAHVHPERPAEIKVEGPFAPAGTVRNVDDSASGLHDPRAPEQAAGQPVDTTANLFSAGLLVTEYLLGRHAWERARAADGIDRFDGAALVSRVGGLPRGVADLLRAMLETDPALRPVNAAAALKRLSAARRRPAGASPKVAAAAMVLAAQVLLAVGAWLIWDTVRGGIPDDQQVPPHVEVPDAPIAPVSSDVTPAGPSGWMRADAAAFAEAERSARDQKDLREVFGHYRDFLEAFPKSDHGPAALQALRDTKAAFQAEAEQVLEGILVARDRAESEGRFKDAADVLDRLPGRYSLTHAARRAEREKQRTLERAAAAHFKRERYARSLGLAGRFDEAIRHLSVGQTSGLKTLEDRAAQLRRDLKRALDRQRASRAADVEKLKLDRIAREMKKFRGKIFDWAQFGKYDDVRRYCSGILKDPGYAAFGSEIASGIEDVAGIERFEKRIAANLKGLVGRNYRFATRTRQTFQGEVVAIEEARIRIRAGGAETVFASDRVNLATWMRIGMADAKEGKIQFRVVADAGLYLLSRRRVDEAEKEFQVAAEGVGLRLIKHYEKLVRWARVRGAAGK